ncbi:heavy-metal-associated domain-containing protein [Runella sp.]|uniref:heavy-metal-associated domain-containing protein n=1 Tax=Runella sp. TaxID=1960881 RepID=UPI003D0AB94F
MTRIISITLNVGLTGLVHLLCCWLPLLVVLFNGASIAWLAEYRIPLIALQLGALAWSFYDLYLRHSHEAALFEKKVFWVAVGLTVVLNLIPHRYFQAEEGRLAQAQMERIRSTRVAQFELKTPLTSVEKLNNTLQSVEGVVPSQIKLNDEVVSVRYYLGKTSDEAILATLRKQGYQVSMID